MKFLTDQCVFAATSRFISALGHDVVTAAQLGLAQATDAALLQIAQAQGRILVTRDRDFGSLVFLQGTGAGVTYLRMVPATQNVVHTELERVLTLYAEPDLLVSFVVVEPGRHRIRRPRQGP
jgi:predicted nuclease of predicted toxin-antitoxin system